MTVSTYASVLEERGFVRISDPVPPEVAEEKPVTFSYGKDPRAQMTLVIDELYQGWLKRGIQDVSDLGFTYTGFEEPVYIDDELNVFRAS